MSAPASTDHLRPAPRARFTLSPERYRAITVFALVVVCLVVLTGAAVRLTGSGMGCSTWPNCSSGQLVEFSNANQTVEQTNRLFSGIAGIGVGVVVVVGALRRRPYRRDLLAWAGGVLGGVVAQIPLGGITVLTHNHPAAVGAHFVLSMILVVCATTLVWRAGQPDGARRPTVGTVDLNLSRVAVLTAAVLMVTGPVVTGSGPHGGDASARRFGYFIPDVARIHSINMWVFLGVVVVLLVRLARNGAAADVQRRGRRLLAMIVVQGAIGYTQYELGIPEWLVLLHIAGATAIVGLTVWFHLGLSEPVSATRPEPEVASRVTSTAGADPGESVGLLEPDLLDELDLDRPWVVLVWNDPINLMSYVALVLQQLFGYSKEKAHRLMMTVHTEGKAVVSSGTRSEAERDVFRLHEHGLWATMQQD